MLQAWTFPGIITQLELYLLDELQKYLPGIIEFTNPFARRVRIDQNSQDHSQDCDPIQSTDQNTSRGVEVANPFERAFQFNDSKKCEFVDSRIQYGRS